MEIKLEEAIQYVEKYIDNRFDINLFEIARKKKHTFKVMKLSEDISKKLQLTNEEIQIAKFIGLFHDIARFEQYAKYETFSDINSIDHGDYAIEILKDNNILQQFISDRKYDKIITTAIINHNKYTVQENLSPEELKFVKIIRDADKLDLFSQAIEYVKSKEQMNELNKSIVSEKILKLIEKNVMINRIECETVLDDFLILLAFVFDINYLESIKIINEKQYIDKLLSRFEFTNENTETDINNIRVILNKYIKTRLR